MFKFLFGRKGAEVATETQRQTVERALAEVNEVLAALPEKATIAVDMEAGTIALTLPEQMPDEALALPAPQSEPKVTADEPKSDADAPEATEGDTEKKAAA